MKKDKEIDAFIYIVKYKGEEHPSIQVDGPTNELIAMAMSVIVEDEIFQTAVVALVEIEERGGIDNAIKELQ